MIAVDLLSFMVTGSFGPVTLGLSKAELLAVLGEPDDVGGASRKHRQPSIFRYGDIEFHFGHGPSSPLWLIHFELEQGAPQGGKRLVVEPWLLDASLSLAKLRAAATGLVQLEERPWPYEPGAVLATTPSGVSLIFLLTEGTDRLACVDLCSLPLMNMGIGQ